MLADIYYFCLGHVMVTPSVLDIQVLEDEPFSATLIMQRECDFILTSHLFIWTLLTFMGRDMPRRKVWKIWPMAMSRRGRQRVKCLWVFF